MYFYVKKIEELISEKELPRAILSFGMQRKNEILSISNKKKKLESAAATMLLHQLLVDFGYDKDEIIKNEQGAPELKNQKEVFCSISHSGEYVACAISEKKIGIDIQEMKEGKRTKISERFFHEKEQKLCELDYSLELFYKIWTSKESYVKMNSCGLAGNMHLFYLDLPGNHIISEGNEIMSNVYFEQIDGYMLCISSGI